MQKSGYFARSAPANAKDFALIKQCVDFAVDCALKRQPGLIGQDEERGDELRAIEFPRIKGGKAFDVSQPWFKERNCRPLSADISTIDPMRKPSRMPRLTHELVSHLPSPLRSAARISPRLSAALNSANNAKSSSEYSFASRAVNFSMASRIGMHTLKQSEFPEHLANACAALFLNRHQRQPELFFQQTHHRHCCLYRSGAGLDEIDLHQRQ